MTRMTLEKENPDLADVRPMSYHILESRTLASEPELRSIRSNDLTVVSSKKGDSKVPAPSENLQDSVVRFDFVLANPPFNVSKIDKKRLAGDPRYPFGIPRTDNGNYLWIQHFHSALNKNGRARLVPQADYSSLLQKN